VLFVSIAVSMKINRRHYFRSCLRTLNIISQPRQWMTLCPPTFDRLRPLSVAAHTIGDVVFLLQSINTNRTLCKQDTARLCYRWHLVQGCYAVLLQCISGQFQHHLMYGQSDITAAIQVIPSGWV